MMFSVNSSTTAVVCLFSLFDHLIGKQVGLWRLQYPLLHLLKHDLLDFFRVQFIDALHFLAHFGEGRYDGLLRLKTHLSPLPLFGLYDRLDALLLLLHLLFNGGDYRNHLFRPAYLVRLDGDDIFLSDYGVGLVCLVNDLLKSIVGHYGKLVHLVVAGSLPIGKAQAPSDGLLAQGHGGRRPQGDDGIDRGS